MDNIVKKAGKRLYMLYQLKRAGITQKDLVSVYVSMVRPVLRPVHTTNIKAYIARLITPFSYKLYIGQVVKLVKTIRVQI